MPINNPFRCIWPGATAVAVLLSLYAPPAAAQVASVPNGLYRLRNALSNATLDVQSADSRDGAFLQQWQYWGGKNQLWKVDARDGGAYSLMSLATSKVVDVSEISTKPAAKVWQWTWLNGANQRWAFRPGRRGDFSIVSVNSGMCLEVIGIDSTANGVGLQQWPCTGTSNQQWFLEPATQEGQLTSPAVGQVCFFMDTKFEGDSLCTAPSQVGTVPKKWSQQFSSARIPANYDVTLYAHANQKGRSLHLTQDTADFVALGFNDAAVSWSVQYNGSAPGPEQPPTDQPPSDTTPDQPPSSSPPVGSYPPADASNIRPTAINARGGDAPTFIRPNNYEYAPVVLFDSGVYRMWWCSSSDSVGGDFIHYAEASTMAGPWHAHGSAAPNSYDTALAPTFNPADFDGLHVCDPSVVRVGTTYYLYYGGLGYQNGAPPYTTAMGVAQSSDGGYTFARMNGGRPIVEAARDFHGRQNPYGAGQPSTIYLDGVFYLLYTDTTGIGGDWTGGTGQYVLRSDDPTFQQNVEELGPDGFAPLGSMAHTGYPLIPSYGSDWQYSDTLQAFLVTVQLDDRMQIWTFDRNLQRIAAPVFIPGAYTEGVGVAALPNKHSITTPTCGLLPFDFMRSVSDGSGRQGPYGWDLAYGGVDYQSNFSGCR